MKLNMITKVSSFSWLNLQNTIHVRTAHKRFVCACTTTRRGLHFLEGSFQCGWRKADGANFPTDGESGRENEKEKERKKERSGREVF